MPEFERTGTAAPQVASDHLPVQRRVDLVAPTPVALAPVETPLQRLAFTQVERGFQRAVADPVLTASALLQRDAAKTSSGRLSLQRQVHDLRARVAPAAMAAALQRQTEAQQAPSRPEQLSGPADLVQLMHAESHSYGQATAGGRYTSQARTQQLAGVQRQVAQGLLQRFRADRSPPEARYAEYGAHLASLERLPGGFGAQAAGVFRAQVPRAEQAPLQRAAEAHYAALDAQDQQDAEALKLHRLQRQLADEDSRVEGQVMQRIRERQGSGDPLPAAVQRHMEQGLNTDLSGVRIHTDGEAHQLSKKAGATAFTSGKDIYFQRSKFDPNSQSGLELLGHELTYVKQQGEGRVGGGVDPDAGLEQQARQMGARLASAAPATQPTRAPAAPTATFSPRALQRAPNTPNTPGPTNTSGPAPRGNMNRRHVLDNLDFYKGTHSGNSYLLKPITDAEIQKLYQEALKKGVRDGGVTLSNGQTWYVRQADGKFHPMSGPGIINLTQQEVAFFRILKAQKGNPEQALENIAKAMRGQRYSMSAEMRIAVQEVAGKLGVPPASVNRIFGSAAGAASHAAPTTPPATPPAAGAAPHPQPAQAPPTSGQVSAAQAERAGSAVEHPTPEMLSAARAKAAGRAFKLVRWGGRVLLLVAVAADSYEIYQSHFSPKVIVKKAGGAAASGVAAEAASPLLAGGPWGWAGYAVIVGGAGVGGYFAGEKITETIYEWGSEK